MNDILSLADFAWISFAHFPVLKTNSPNKFFDALAAGTAILINHKGWVFDLVKTHQLGVSCLPGKMESAFSKLEQLEENPEKIYRMGENARQLSQHLFSKEQAIKRLLEVIRPESRATPGGEVGIRIA